MAFFINENTQTPRLLMNGGSLKVGKGLKIDDDELISLGDVTRAEFELEISSIKNNVQLNTESILTLSSDLEGAVGNITANSSKIETLTNNLGEIIGTVKTQSLSILDLNSRFDSAEATLSAHTSSISDLTNKTNVNSQSILDLQTNLKQATADIQTTHSEISGLQSSIDGKLDTSDFWTTLGYDSEEEFKQAISESGLTQEQLDALKELTDGKYLSTDSFLELISDPNFASSEIGSKLLEITKNNVDDQTIINAVTSQAGLSTLATALGASSELTSKFATIQSVTDLADDLATETTNRTEAISSLQQSVNDKVSSAELQTSLGNYYDKSTVDGIVENAKTEARSGLLLESELEQAIANLNTYYTKTDVDNNISTATSGLLATSDLSSAIADLNAYYTKTEADSATTTAIGNFRTEANNTFAKTSDIAKFITEDEANGLISTATAGFVAQADYNTAQANMNSRIDGVEASVATAVTRDPDTGKVTSTVTFGANNAALNADGSGYMALGNLSWNTNGDLTIKTAEDSSYNRNEVTLTEKGFHVQGDGVRAVGTSDFDLDGINLDRSASSFGTSGGLYELGFNVNGLKMETYDVNQKVDSIIKLDLGEYNEQTLDRQPSISIETEEDGQGLTPKVILDMEGLKIKKFISSKFAVNTTSYGESDINLAGFHIEKITLGGSSYLQISNGLLVDGSGNLGVNDNGTFKQGLNLSDTSYTDIASFIGSGSDQSNYTIKNGLIVAK